MIDGVVPPRQMLEHPSHTSFSFSHIVRSRDLKSSEAKFRCLLAIPRQLLLFLFKTHTINFSLLELFFDRCATDSNV